ncbi:hypothetical protein [Thalassobellus suaedae]|uniref:DUF7793 domain-containing protein n=1 Tax=Thalassobellus suaedae TaxID=3074124 RepID=A0ABY9Y4Z6_9FLAO|nr:hypothetical protein RHP51_12565 [Flavobacteriaceae bacterium HL-DH14]WNH13332.1 hypothetical protein RHP49_03530 [Flavobacteriaceae bacterium HL-DH10]
MKSYELSFGVISILNSNLAEVIVGEGIEMNEVMVDEYHDFLLNNLSLPILLLINKKNSYSYTFEAQISIGNLKEIKAMAVLIGTSGGLMSTETLININKENNWNIKLFQKRDQALNWLNTQHSVFVSNVLVSQ